MRPWVQSLVPQKEKIVFYQCQNDNFSVLINIVWLCKKLSFRGELGEKYTGPLNKFL
jgi:hypothetical protein